MYTHIHTCAYITRTQCTQSTLLAESYAYLRDFAQHFDGDQSLSIRPNYSFSLALAALRRQQQQQQQQVGYADTATHTLARACAQDTRVYDHSLLVSSSSSSSRQNKQQRVKQ